MPFDVRWYHFLLLSLPVWLGLSTNSNKLVNTVYTNQLPNIDGYLHTGYYSTHNVKNIVSQDLVNKHIVLFTAHPDDETMFFGPTITELTKTNYNNYFHLICLSNGGMDGLGKFREQELEKAARILSIDSAKTLNYEDNINVFWNTDDIVDTVNIELDHIMSDFELQYSDIVIITFDQYGVSGHPNHRSISDAIHKFKNDSEISMYKLVSWSVFHKYSGILVSTLELLGLQILEHSDTSIPQFTIYSDFNTWSLNISAMSWAHFSQMVWFRWIWVFTSAYMNANELVAI